MKSLRTHLEKKIKGLFKIKNYEKRKQLTLNPLYQNNDESHLFI